MITHKDYPPLAKRLAPAKRGNVVIDHRTVSKDEAKWGNMMNAMNGDRFGHVDPGTYARLKIDGEIMMTDTQMEWRTNWAVMHYAHGRVLIAGLGLGMILHPILDKPDVERVTVLEANRDVIRLVKPSLRKYTNLEIIHADAFTWRIPAGRRWNVIYFDIWPTASENNLPEYARLVRHYQAYRNRADPMSWMGGWRIEEMRARRDSARRAGAGW